MGWQPGGAPSTQARGSRHPPHGYPTSRPHAPHALSRSTQGPGNTGQYASVGVMSSSPQHTCRGHSQPHLAHQHFQPHPQNRVMNPFLALPLLLLLSWRQGVGCQGLRPHPLHWAGAWFPLHRPIWKDTPKCEPFLDPQGFPQLGVDVVPSSGAAPHPPWDCGGWELLPRRGGLQAQCPTPSLWAPQEHMVEGGSPHCVAALCPASLWSHPPRRP